MTDDLTPDHSETDPPTGDVTAVVNGILTNVHRPSVCAGQHCWVHNPSQHHMVAWPVLWREDKTTAERVCEHGLGHPDPDDADYNRRQGRDVTVHGCDGCCGVTPTGRVTWRPGGKVDSLSHGIGGRWFVTTQGSEHVWDLDAMTYRRIPGVGRGQFDYDNETHPISRVDFWPEVGSFFRVWYDDPHDPHYVEQFRQSTAVRSIERLEEVDE